MLPRCKIGRDILVIFDFISTTLEARAVNPALVNQILEVQIVERHQRGDGRAEGGEEDEGGARGGEADGKVESGLAAGADVDDVGGFGVFRVAGVEA